MSRDKFTYTHGDTGTEPASALDFTKNERPKAQNFDWWWTTVIAYLNGHADEFTRLDSDDDGVVDSADDADTVDGEHASAFADASSVSSIQISSDVDHDSTTGGTDADAHHTRYSDEEAEDAVAAILGGGDKVSVTYDDVNDTLTVDTSALDTEEVEDAVTSLVASDSNLSWSYDDVNGTLTVSLANSISVNTLEAGGWSFIGEFQTLSDFDAAASSGDRGYITDEQQFARQP